MNNPPALGAEITQFVLKSTEDLANRFFPDFRLPAFFAGHRVIAQESADLGYLLTSLRSLGVREIAGQPLDLILLNLLSQVDGPNTETFYSYRVAETLLALGGLDAALEAGARAGIAGGLNRDNLVAAVDSTFIYDPVARVLPRHPNNYWAVLARCELRRRELGLLPADSPYPVCLEKIVNLFRGNSLGFWDDQKDLEGRFDSYSADVQLFVEPLWPEIDPALIERNLRAHVRLLEGIALENGASVAWGRTIGAHSICMTMELGALALKLGYAADPVRMLALVQNAFDEFKTWFLDDLIAAHRGRMTDGYRGLHRLLQMTVDCHGKLAYVAKVLARVENPVPPANAPAPVLFPPIDEFFPMREDLRAGVWMFRNERLAFQFPFTSGSNSTYMAWLNMPGLFTSPVDSPMMCGVPRLLYGDQQYYPSGLPDFIEKSPGKVVARFSHWRLAGNGPVPEKIGAVRELELTVEDDTITGRERWTFEPVPTGIGFDIPDAAHPLHLEITSSTGHRTTTVEVEGIAEWRSAWEVIPRVHQTDVQPAGVVEFTWSVRPAPIVGLETPEHDYTRALYGAIPPRSLAPRPLLGKPVYGEPILPRLGDVEIFNFGWPEHFFLQRGMTNEVLDAFIERSLEELGRSPVKIVWTMHNRRPHHPSWHGERGDRLYRAMAAIADGVIHHSHWGMEYMRADLPYKPSALHTVIRHGHFGEEMRIPQTRTELEAQYGLAPAAIRFGVLGRPQKEKQVELIAAAFMKAARPDQQLIITAHPFDLDVSTDPRIVLIPREKYLSRETIAGHVKLCDALVSAHIGNTYLTSGTIADSIGVGIPTLTNPWGYMNETLGDSAFYHDNTVDGLAELFASLTVEQIEAGKAATVALQEEYSWPVAAAKTAEFMRQVRLAK